jgi:hypothetical protein
MTIVSFFVAFICAALLVYVLRYSGRLRFSLEEGIPVSTDLLSQAVINLEAWSDWAAWQEHDKETRPVFERDANGGIRSVSWSSDKAGKVKIVHLSFGKSGEIVQRIEGQAPFSYKAKLVWRFKPEANGTMLTLAFKGRIGFAQRAFSKTVQKMLQLEFSYAINKIVSHLTQGVNQPDASCYEVDYLGPSTVAAHTLLVRSFQGASKNIAKTLQPLIAQMKSDLSASGDSEAEVFYFQTNLKTGSTKCKYGIVADDRLNDEVQYKTQSSPVFVVRLTGHLQGLEVAWYLAAQHMRALGFQPDQRLQPFERYYYAQDQVTHVDLFFPMK